MSHSIYTQSFTVLAFHPFFIYYIAFGGISLLSCKRVPFDNDFLRAMYSAYYQLHPIYFYSTYIPILTGFHHSDALSFLSYFYMPMKALLTLIVIFIA